MEYADAGSLHDASRLGQLTQFNEQPTTVCGQIMPVHACCLPCPVTQSIYGFTSALAA